jgi:hypothetical protein
MKTHQTHTNRCLWAIGCCLLLAGPSFAAKPQPKPPPDPPPPESAAYRYIELGSMGNLGVSSCKINNAGVVVGIYRNVIYTNDPQPKPIDSSYPFVAIPKDTDTDGLPDVWTITELGIPSALAIYDADGYLVYDISNVQCDINDHGDIVLDFGKDFFVLQPDELGQYVPGDFNGFNPWMTKVILNGGGLGEFVDVPSINNRGQIFGRHCWQVYLGDLTGGGTGDLFNYTQINVGVLVSGMDTDADQIADSWNLIDTNGENQLEEYLWNMPDKYGGMISVYPFGVNHDGWIGGNSPWTSACLLKPRWVDDSLVYWADDNQDKINDLVIPLSPGSSSGVRGINSKGKAIGYQFVNSNNNAMVWQVAPDGTVSSTVFKKTSTTAYSFNAINDEDVIVGSQTVTSRTGTVKSAIVVKGTTIKDLRSLTDQAAALAGLTLGAIDINNAGQIVGVTYYSGGPRAFIAVPNTKP